MELTKMEEREKNKSSLKNSITFFFIFFLLAVFAVFVITSVLQVNTVAGYICSHYASPVVERARALIDLESFERLSKTLDPSDPYYREAQRKLHEIKEETNCLYLYTMAPESGSLFRYIIDGSDVIGGEYFSNLGAEEDLSGWDKAALRAFTTGKSQLGTVDRTESYGATLSAYEPILKGSGEVIGLIACDIDASEIVRWIRTQTLWQMAIVVLLVAVGLTAYLVVMKRVNQTFA